MGQPGETVEDKWPRAKTKRISWWFLLSIALPLWISVWGGTSWSQTGTFCVPTGGEAIQTDKTDYAPGEDVLISGAGFEPQCDVYVRVTRPDGTVFLGDGGTTPGMDVVTTDDAGNFSFTYVRQGNSISGEHVVDVLDSEINVLAFAIFYNPEPPLPLACDFTVDSTLPADDFATSTFRTIQSAVTHLPNPGPCTINVMPGIYHELVNIVSKNTSATEDSQQIVLRAHPAAPVGSVVVAPTTGSSVGFTLTNSSFIAISGFVVSGNSMVRGVSLSGEGNSNWDITIDGNEIYDIGTVSSSGSAGIVVGFGNPRTWIVNNLVRDNARSGILLNGGSGPTYVVNNTVYRNGWNGVLRAYAPIGGNAVAYLINNLIVGNGSGPVTFSYGRFGVYQSNSGSAAQATLRNNLFFRNGVYAGDALTNGGDISPSGILDSTDSDNYTTSGPPNSASGIAGCAFTDCSLVHAFTEIFVSDADLTLSKTPPSLFSPAIDKGRNSFVHDVHEWVPGQDVFGNPRVLDGDEDGAATADIGYSEAPGNDLPPDTILDSGPSGLANTASAVFTFRSTKPGSTFQCRIDGGAETACDDRTVTYSDLTDGTHTFDVWATDSVGLTDLSPASRTWIIDTLPPDTILNATPASLTSDTDATFGFQATEGGSAFECSLDGAPFSACASPKTYTDLGEGSHVFQARAKDEAGNVDSSSAAFSWTVSIPPDTNITDNPPAYSNSSGASFTFTSTKADSTFECSIDGSPFSACSSPAVYSGLLDAGHTFVVGAIDPTGAADPAPAEYTWTIDTAAPDTILDSGPFNPTDLNTATFGFHASEAASAFECSFDGSPFSVCASPKNYSGLVEGMHTFRVRARDLAGNVDPSPATLTFDWTIDTTTLTVVQDVTKTYQSYNQIVYLVATISSSAGVVNEGNVVFRIKNASSTVIATITSPPVSGGRPGNTYWSMPAGTPAGVYTIEAGYSGGSNFKPSTGIGTLFVLRAPASITLGNLVQDYDGTPKPVTATTNPAGIAVSVTYDGVPIPPTNPGSYSVVATVSDPNYIAPVATGVLTIVGKAVPVIAWGNPGDIVYPTPLSGLQLNATADVPGAFVYSPEAGVVLDAGIQTLRVDFIPADTVTYSSTFATVPIIVLKGPQSIRFEPLVDRTFGEPDFTLAATASSNLPVTFDAIGSCTIVGELLHITGAGNCTVTAWQDGDGNFQAAPDVTRTFNIFKAQAAMNVQDLTQIYDGLPKYAIVITDPLALDGVSVTYDGGWLPPTEAGSYAVTASLLNANYQAADAGGTLTILRAEAGLDQTVDEGGAGVTVGSPLSYGESYSWEQLAGPPVFLSDSGSPMPGFLAPPLQGGFGSQVVTFELTVTGGGRSTTDTVNVTVVNVNHAPVADAGNDLFVKEEAPVTLSGSHSYDPDDDSITFQWVQTAGIEVVLSGADTDNVVFTAPLLPGGIGSLAMLTFQLTVSDGDLVDTKTINVTVEQVNHAPTANAGENQTWNEGSLVTLNGGGTDPDGDSLTYRWTQESGPSVSISSDQLASPSFTAPAVGPGGATLVFQLSVNDGLLDSEPDVVTVTVHDVNDPPACAVARADQEVLWPPNHKLVPVAIIGITDPNNDTVRITITGVTQDEPVDGLGDGDTSPDAVLQEDEVLLRAERAGNGNGRVYEVAFIAEDGSGGSCTGIVRIGVPPNMKPGVSAIDDGQAHFSIDL